MGEKKGPSQGWADWEVRGGHATPKDSSRLGHIHAIALHPNYQNILSSFLTLHCKVNANSVVGCVAWPNMMGNFYGFVSNINTYFLLHPLKGLNPDFITPWRGDDLTATYIGEVPLISSQLKAM